MNPPTSDLQHLAQVLDKVMRGDQVTVAESHRLKEIADFGYTRGGVPPSDAPTVVDAPHVTHGDFTNARPA
jgi:hypothetical protein